MIYCKNSLKGSKPKLLTILIFFIAALAWFLFSSLSPSDLKFSKKYRNLIKCRSEAIGMSRTELKELFGEPINNPSDKIWIWIPEKNPLAMRRNVSVQEILSHKVDFFYVRLDEAGNVIKPGMLRRHELEPE